MTDSVRDLLDRAVGWFEPPEDLLDAARRRMEHRRVRRRVSAGAIGLVVSILGAVLLWQAFRPTSGGQVIGGSAANYIFSQVAVGPALDPDNREPIPGLALVEFTLTWSSLEYPGVHSCRWSLYDASGAEVGSTVAAFDSMQPTVRGGIEIPVDGIPERAEGGCNADRLDTPVAYLISNAVVEADEHGGIAVAFDVAWPESLGPGGYPGVNACEARVLSQAGEVLARYVFTLSVGEGRVTQRVGLNGAEREAVSGIDPAELTARVECEPWTSDYLKTELTPIPHPGDQRAFGPGMVLATGEVDGTPWRLLAYQSESGLCVDVEIARGAIGGCGPVPIGHDLELGQGSVMGVDRTIIHGEISERVASVEVRPIEGDPFAADIIPDPGGLGVNFFVLFVPRGTVGEIAALDASGNVLQSVRLRPLEGERPPTCCREDVLDEHNITVYYPLDWVRTGEPLIGRVEGVEEIFSVGTFAMTPGVGECEDLPARAMESMGPADALVTLQEASANDGFGPRPRDFATTTGDTSDSIDCLSSGEQLSVEGFTFSERGRDFRAYVVFGSEVPEETKRSAWQVLENFLVCDPASRPGDCL